MRTKPALVFTLICLAAVIVLGYLYLWRDRDEQIINRNLNNIIELAEKQGDESPFLILTQSREILRYVAQQPEFYIGPPLPAVRDRNEISAIVAQARQTLGGLSIRVVERSVSIALDRQSAEMDLEAEATISYMGEARRDRRRFEIDWIREEGDWVIQRVRMVEGEALPPLDLPF